MSELELSRPIELETFLAHYGKKGMRWGVVNEEPGGSGSPRVVSNPLAQLRAHNLKVNTEHQATINARAAKSQVRVNEIKAELAALNLKPSTSANKFQRDSLTYQLQDSQKQAARDSKAASKEATTGLTQTQKKVLIGVSVAAAIGLTAVAVYNKDEISAFARVSANKHNFQDYFPKNDRLAAANTPDSVFAGVVHGTNPRYSSMGGKMNCRRATFAYELRRRGYDVVATTSAVGKGQNETGLVNALITGDRNLRSQASLSSFVQKSYDPVESIRTRARANDPRQYDALTDSLNFGRLGAVFGVDTKEVAGSISKSLSSQPTGARGEIAFNMNRFVHSMQYEVFDGVPHIFDSQKATHYPVTEEGISKLVSKWGAPSGAAITRLDNMDLDMDFLAKWVTNG